MHRSVSNILALAVCLVLGVRAHAQFTTIINVPPGTVPENIGSNTQVNISAGAALNSGSLVWAGDESTTSNIEINVTGGSINSSLFMALHGATVNASGGFFRYLNAANTGVINLSNTVPVHNLYIGDGGVLNMSGGAVGSDFRIGGGGVANITGGHVSTTMVVLGTATVSGGEHYNYYAGGEAAQLTLLPGVVGGVVTVGNGGRADVHAGAFGDGFRTIENGQLHLYGDFRLNGAPIPGLGAVGNSVALDLGPNDVLTEVQSDGSILAFLGSEEFLTPGTLTLHAVAAPTAGPTVYTVPADAAPRGLREGQTLHLGPSGTAPNNFVALPGSTVNITGGTMGDNFEAIGATVKVTGGDVGSGFDAVAGSRVELLGGQFSSSERVEIRDSDVLFDGAWLWSGAIVYGGSATYKSGLFGTLEFRGAEVAVTGGGLSGLVLSEGSTATISGGQHLGSGGIFSVSDSSVSITGGGIRGGGSFSSQINGSLLNISGGSLSNVKASATEINLSGGVAQVDLGEGTHLTMTGGGLGYTPSGGGWSSIDADAGSHFDLIDGMVGGFFTRGTANISGGEMHGPLHVQATGSALVSGGKLDGGVFASAGGQVYISGGEINGGIDADGGKVTLSGGKLGDQVRFTATSDSLLTGAEFQINGVPVAGLGAVGDETDIVVPLHATLTGVLADGRAFTMYNNGAEQGGDEDQLEGATLTLRRANVPAATPGVIPVPGAAPPPGLRAGQSLALGPGGDVGDNFTAHPGAQIAMTGGAIGANFEAVGAQVNISGGAVGPGMDAMLGSQIVLSGGEIGEDLDLYDGSSLHVSGGQVAETIEAVRGSSVTLTGGLINDLDLDQSTATIGGGEFDRIEANNASSVTMTHGKGSQLAMRTGSSLNFQGGQVSSISATNSTVAISGGVMSSVSAANVLMTGGTITSSFTALGVTSISGGSVGTLALANGSQVTISGTASVGGVAPVLGSTVTVLGGHIGAFNGVAGSQVVLRGGTQGNNFRVVSTSTGRIVGGEFLLNGAPIAGLGSAIGSTVTLPAASTTTFVLTGTLADGTPFALNAADADAYAAGRLTLEVAALPAISPPVIHTATDGIPRGVRRLQTLYVDAGTALGDNFTAGAGSILHVAAGATVGANLEVVNANVTLAGTVGNDFDALQGSVVTMTGGSLGNGVDVHAGSTVEIAGGVVGQLLDAMNGSTVNISGGSVGNRLNALAGSTVNVSGGSVGDQVQLASGAVINQSGGSIGSRLNVVGGGRINITGGVVGDNLLGMDNSIVALYGDDFRINGTPIANPSMQNSIPFGAAFVLSGTLADGTPFAFSDQDIDSYRGNAGNSVIFRLNVAPVAPVGPANIVASTSPLPLGIREGQTLTVDAGGIVPKNFMAGRGSTVNIQPGGAVGDNFEATSAVVTMTGGTLGAEGDAFHGSVVTIQGGTVGNHFQVGRDAVLNVRGGVVGANLEAYLWGTVNVSGGTVGNNFRALALSTVNVSGGTIGDGFRADIQADVNISGGSFGPLFRADSGSTVELAGDDFRLDGVPVAGLNNLGDVVQKNLSGMALTGILSDGTPFAFSSGDADSIANGSLSLRKAAVAPTGPASYHVPTDAAPKYLRAGQSLSLAAGGVLGNNFTAGRGSSVLMSGGSIGTNFELIGANVDITGGTIANGFDAFDGTVVNLSAGTLGSVQIHPGATLNMTGGAIEGGLNTMPGSVLNISGGTIPSDNDRMFIIGGAASISGGDFHGVLAQNSSPMQITGGSFYSLGTFGQVSISGGNFGQLAAGGGALNFYAGRVQATDSEQVSEITASYGTVNLYGGTLDAQLKFEGDGVTRLVGSSFQLNGAPILGFTLGETFDVPRPLEPQILTGVLADGSPFEFDLWSSYTLTDSSLKLVLVKSTAGDFDRDGVVDLDDLALWRASAGVNAAADADHDGDSDGADFMLWQRQLGNTLPTFPPPIAAAVPEPAAGGLFLVAACILLRRRTGCWANF